MAGQTYQEQSFIGGGRIKLNIKNVDGIFEGFQDVGNADIFEIKPENETKERVSFRAEDFGQALDTDIAAKPTKIKLAFDNMTAENIALALSATLIRNNGAASGSVTDEVHYAYHNKQIRLKHRNISNLVISTPTAGTGALYTTDDAGYAVGAKVINLITGTGTILEGGAVTFDGDTTRYAVDVGLSAPGTITLKRGLKKAIPAAATDVTLVAAIATLSATTDYLQDEKHSHFIKILDTGLIADGGKVQVDYDYAEVEQNTLLGGLASFDCMIELNGINRKGKPFTVYADKVTMASASGFGFLSKEFVKAEMDGTANVGDDVNSPGYGVPYRVDTDIVVTA